MGYLHHGGESQSFPQQTCTCCGKEFQDRDPGMCISCTAKKYAVPRTGESVLEREYRKLCAASSGTVMLHTMGEESIEIPLPSLEEFLEVASSGYQEITLK